MASALVRLAFVLVVVFLFYSAAYRAADELRYIRVALDSIDRAIWDAGGTLDRIEKRMP